MKFRKHLILILLIFIIGLSSVELSGQAVKQKPSRQSSMEVFSRGDYEKAYYEFSELLKAYSKDPLYKYYSAVCLVNLGRNSKEAVKLLQEALDGNVSARQLPKEASFYLGRAMQLSGMYSEAIGSYHIYSDLAGKKVAKEQGVPEFIQQCIDKEGALPDEVVVIEEKETEPVPEAFAVVTVIPEKELPQKEFLSEEYSTILDEALAFQLLADSVGSLLADQKTLLEKLPEDKKPELKSKIAGYELLAVSYQKSADLKYKEAQSAMNPEKEIPELETIAHKTDSLLIKNTDIESDKKKIDAYTVADTVEIYYYFEVLKTPVADPKEKIKIEPDVPPGLIYRIQIAVFRNPVSPVYFKGISPVYGFKSEGSDLKIYYAGMFRRISDAKDALVAVKGKGFKDSFIASFYGKKVISADRAIVLEKEWGKKPFEKLVSKVSVVAPADTLPPTLTFRVEVMRTVKPAKPVKQEIIEEMKEMAGTRGLNIQTLDDGQIVYLIGNFITFASAAEYADLIVRNGYRNARVTAWLGKKEISVDTARQLFEKIE